MSTPKKAKNEPPTFIVKNISLIEAIDLKLKSDADKKAGYPPNCNEGYVEKDGKCVPVEDGEHASFKYEDPKTREIYLYQRRGIYKKNGRILIYRGEDK